MNLEFLHKSIDSSFNEISGDLSALVEPRVNRVVEVDRTDASLIGGKEEVLADLEPVDVADGIALNGALVGPSLSDCRKLKHEEDCEFRRKFATAGLIMKIQRSLESVK